MVTFGRKDWRTDGFVAFPGAGAAGAAGAPGAGGAPGAAGAAGGGAGPTSRDALRPNPRLCVPATTRYTVPAALAAPSAAC